MLSKRFDILFLNPPVSSYHALRSRDSVARTLEEVEPGIHVRDTVTVPGVSRTVARPIVERQLAKSLRRSLTQFTLDPVATITTLPYYNVFPEIGKRVYWAKDDHFSGSGLYGASQSLIERSETRLALNADVVVTCSLALQQKWREKGATTFYLPNGCDLRHFRPSSPTSDDEPQPAVYLGTLTDRIDNSFLNELVAQGIRLRIVGGIRANKAENPLEELLKHPGVEALGHRSYAELPALLHSSSVGLIPYRLTDYNKASFPLKVFEYLAAGLPVVSSQLPSVEWIDSDDVALVNNATEFAAEVKHQYERIPQREDVERRVSVASRHSWDNRAAQLLDFLRL